VTRWNVARTLRGRSQLFRQHRPPRSERLHDHLERIGRTHAVPSAPSPRDAGGRHAPAPAGPSLTPGLARVTGTKASVAIAIALGPRVILRRRGAWSVVKGRAAGCSTGCQGPPREKDGAVDDVSAAGAGGAGPGAGGRSGPGGRRMACTEREPCAGGAGGVEGEWGRANIRAAA